MANETPYKLMKPTENEFYDIEVANNNMDKIDTELKNLQETKINLEVIPLGTDIPVSDRDSKTLYFKIVGNPTGSTIKVSDNMAIASDDYLGTGVKVNPLIRLKAEQPKSKSGINFN